MKTYYPLVSLLGHHEIIDAIFPNHRYFWNWRIQVGWVEQEYNNRKETTHPLQLSLKSLDSFLVYLEEMLWDLVMIHLLAMVYYTIKQSILTISEQQSANSMSCTLVPLVHGIAVQCWEFWTPVMHRQVTLIEFFWTPCKLGCISKIEPPVIQSRKMSHYNNLEMYK